MARYRLDITYDGTRFRGWQRQPEGPTVQQEIEEALAVATRQQTAITGSGRTDAGVHARGQVAHFDSDTPLDIHRLQASLNGLLPRAIRIRGLSPVSDEFHARYDAVARTYVYQVSTIPTALDQHTRVLVPVGVDFDRMNEAASDLYGTHDFDAFCRTRSETTNRVCTVEQAAWESEERSGDWRFRISADRYLHGMVRAIVGSLLQVGKGTRPSDDLPRIIQTHDRREAGPAAPARGLVLEAVTYPLEEQGAS